jgi:glycosyltransferase involved in cell wall biosynthesis
VEKSFDCFIAKRKDTMEKISGCVCRKRYFTPQARYIVGVDSFIMRADVAKLKIFRISPWPLFFYREKEGSFTSSFEYFLLRKFIDAGHEIHYIIPATNTPRDFVYHGIHVHEFKYFKNISVPTNAISRFISRIISLFLFVMPAVMKTLQMSRKTRPNVIYGCAPSGALAAYAVGRIYNIPNITRLYGTFLGPTMYLHNLFWLMRFFEELLALKIPSEFMIITNDGTRGDVAAKLLGFPLERLKFWMNGVPSRMFKLEFNVTEFKEKLRIPLDKKIVISVSRLAKWKGVDRLINAIPSILSRQSNVLFLIIGDGPERKNLENLSRKLRVADYVRFLGAVDHDVVGHYIKLTDIFVSLFDYSNVGSQLLEALTCGACIVTLNSGGTGEIIRNGLNGILLEYSNLDQLPNTVVNLLRNEELTKRLKRGAYDYAAKHIMTWDERAEVEIRSVEDLFR